MNTQSTSGPGAALGSVRVAVRTREARMLLRGRRAGDGRDIPGLQAFADRAWTAGRMSARDDPFADYALIQVEAACREANEMLRETRDLRLPRWREAVSARSDQNRPMSMRIRFDAYSGMAMSLILQADDVVHMLQTMAALGMLERKRSYRDIDELVRRIRGMMWPMGTWAPTGCTRRDLARRGDTAVAAVELLIRRGFINPSMFNGPDDICDFFANYGYRPEFAPVVDPEALSEDSGGQESQ